MRNQGRVKVNNFYYQKLQIIVSLLFQQNYKQIRSKSCMEAQDRTQYLCKIEEIRQRIQTKQSTNRQSKLKGYQTLQGQNGLKSARVDPFSIADDLSKRRPLQSAQNKANQFQERVKQLDSVSERIKVLLSNKRTPTVNIQNTPRSIQLVQPPKSEKLTSLFQKEIQFSESKVGEGYFTDLKSRDITTFKEKLNPPIESYRQAQIPTQSQNSQIYQQIIQRRPQMQPQAQKPFDIQAFKKRFIKQMSKDSPTDRCIDVPPQSTPQPQPIIDKYESISTKRQSSSIKSSSQSSSTPQTKKLLSILAKQIELQAKLRASKEKFDAFRAQNKMNLLRDELKKRRISISQKQLQEWIKIEQEQFDPFVSLVFTKDFNFDELIANWMQAKTNWEQKVKKCVELEELKKEYFKIKEVEGFKKGFIYLQDFVCFINLKNGCFLKNRDLFSLFKHFMMLQSAQMSVEHKIKHETFMGYVSR